ncbi:YqcI/YcgG family protein [Peribacillus cavernae]|uniref:YqcI/YcgG family protein n=1 Tax=Peribacillus cavernae TaxID=1674310 RepID=A0A3S0W9Z7_9BACI|nr:YqcI/YcgG family protein [Peribacillus cavernae]MDQ0218815.1 FPC/CPF motif-containing protein YcgG [Peribacillus cavernae]RUQ31023.1 YqcI/YcgG family protein [Peribacillus cavernae]
MGVMNINDYLHTLANWKQDALDSFSKKMSDQNKWFPCIPAVQGFALNHFRYGFGGKPDNDTTALQVAALLKEFSIQSKDYGSNTSLIIFLETPDEMVEDGSVDYFEELFWKLLSTISSMDEKEWVAPIPVNPESSLWEYCFHGEQYFVYCATPAHKSRKSRHFPCFMLAITPRWVLNEFNVNQTYAGKIKGRIQTRLIEYDNISPHPDLNVYGAEENLEWKQYFLRDDKSSLGSCPFYYKK